MTGIDTATGDILVQQPAPSGAAAPELVMFFHGVGSDSDDLRPLAAFVAQAMPHAWIVSVRAPDRADFGHGWQWFSVQGITEQTRPARIAATLPRFTQRIAEWQRATGVTPARTTLVGFSQGAIMALESTQSADAPAARVISIAGRFSQPPRIAHAHVSVHLLHGEEDRVVPAAFAVEAATALQALGARASLTLFPGLGHGIDEALARQLRQLLTETASTAA
jgi:phospholipase/carboxylesterase